MVPAALALAEGAEAPVSGRRLALGIALGVDMLCRLRMGAGKSKAIGWMAETMAPMSIAAMGSTAARTRRRRRCSTPSAWPTRRAAETCSRRSRARGACGCRPGWRPRPACSPSTWRAKGSGGRAIRSCGEFGLYRLYFRGDYDEDALLGELGERNEIVNNSLKPYPTCKYTHHAIATALEPGPGARSRAEQVRRVTVATNTMGATQCGFDATGAPKTAPETASAAKFSIPFTVAAAIARRQVTLEEFTEERDPRPRAPGAGRPGR